MEPAAEEFAFAVHVRCFQAEDPAAERPGLGTLSSRGPGATVPTRNLPGDEGLT
jgi:hypothetical protein